MTMIRSTQAHINGRLIEGIRSPFQGLDTYSEILNAAQVQKGQDEGTEHRISDIFETKMRHDDNTFMLLYGLSW